MAPFLPRARPVGRPRMTDLQRSYMTTAGFVAIRAAINLPTLLEQRAAVVGLLARTGARTRRSSLKGATFGTQQAKEPNRSSEPGPYRNRRFKLLLINRQGRITPGASPRASTETPGPVGAGRNGDVEAHDEPELNPRHATGSSSTWPPYFRCGQTSEDDLGRVSPSTRSAVAPQRIYVASRRIHRKPMWLMPVSIIWA